MGQKQWTLREIRSSDFEQVSRFGWSGRKCFTPQSLVWKIFDNPYQEGIINVADHSGRIIGTTTITPKQLAIKDELINGAEIGDTFTASDYQRQGIFSSLVFKSRKETINKGLAFIYGTPNSNSLPGYEKNVILYS